MWDLEILGVDLYHILAWLYLYSFLGWLWESAYVSVKEKKLVNRGYITGPLCTIYGVGAVGVFLILRPLQGNWIALYFGGVIVATVLEYITAVIMEGLFHTSWWDYSNKKFNFQGRICLGSSAAWGLFTLIMFAVLQPFVEMIVGWFTISVGKIVLITVTVLYAVDFTLATVTAMKLGKKLAQMERVMADLAEHLQESRIYASAAEFMDRLEPYRLGLNRVNIKEKMTQYQEMLTKRIESLGLNEQKEATLEKLRMLSEKLGNTVAKGNWNSRRLIKAYPNLSRASRLRRKSLRQTRHEKKEKEERKV